MGHLKVGDEVQQSNYGLGVITAVAPDRITIDFVEHGTKKFVASIVQLVATGNTVVLAAKSAAKARSKKGPRATASRK